MGIEIERKFLVKDDSWRAAVSRSMPMRQGYIRSPDVTIRVRIKGADAILTFKGATTGVTRGEWQWPIPLQDANELMEAFCGERIIEKVRHHVEVAGHVWVVDVFEGPHEGLVLAEIELESEDEDFVKPSWAGAEVSHDARYYNSNLAAPRSTSA